MKFGITGVHCTGKTTLINALEATGKFNDYYFITNQTRALKNKVVINEQANDATQLAVIAATANTAIIENSIDDRCVLDTLVYTLGLYKRNQVNELTLLEVFRKYDEYIGNYTALFYTPPEFPFIADGVRSEDLTWRNLLADIFVNVIRTIVIPVFIVKGTVEERVNYVANMIDIYGVVNNHD